MTNGDVTIDTLDDLVEVIGTPIPRVANKARPRLHDLDRQWLAASPLCVLATADAAGRCDASPKGDPAGSLVHVLDDSTLVLAERPGNRRADGYRNIIENPYVGLIFMIPGRGDTLRVNGRARLVADAPFFDELIVKGHRPLLALVIEVDEVYHHCAKAFLRSQLWQPQTWRPDALPSVARLTKELVAPEDDVEELERHDGQSYTDGLYTAPPPEVTHPGSVPPA